MWMVALNYGSDTDGECDLTVVKIAEGTRLGLARPFCTADETSSLKRGGVAWNCPTS